MASLLIVIALFRFDPAVSQLIVRGMVVDSASMQSLPNVNITVKNGGPGTTTDIHGAFQIQASERDTIVFSRVGYHTRAISAANLNDKIIVFLKEERRMLKPVEVNEGRPIWLPEILPESPWQNTTFKSQSGIPGQPGIQTFGPGYVIKGPFSRFSKEEKEKQKLRRVRDENYRSRTYVGLVNDPDVKGRIMKDYGLTEDDYYDGLASFNERNKDIIYRLDSDDLIALLILFFSEYKPPK